MRLNTKPKVKDERVVFVALVINTTKGFIYSNSKFCCKYIDSEFIETIIEDVTANYSKNYHILGTPIILYMKELEE